MEIKAQIIVDIDGKVTNGGFRIGKKDELSFTITEAENGVVSFYNHGRTAKRNYKSVRGAISAIRRAMMHGIILAEEKLFEKQYWA